MFDPLVIKFHCVSTRIPKESMVAQCSTISAKSSICAANDCAFAAHRYTIAKLQNVLMLSINNKTYDYKYIVRKPFALTCALWPRILMHTISFFNQDALTIKTSVGIIPTRPYRCLKIQLLITQWGCLCWKNF